MEQTPTNPKPHPPSTTLSTTQKGTRYIDPHIPPASLPHLPPPAKPSPLTPTQGLPPVYFQICGMDPLRDEALIYEKVLREEYNIPTKLDVYPGLPHGFWSFWPDMKASTEFVNDATKGVAWLLEQKK
jgi:acetyl esterase/lipase